MTRLRDYAFIVTNDDRCKYAHGHGARRDSWSDRLRAFLVLFLIWFSLAKGKVTWSEITDAGVFTVAAQVAFSLVVICVVTLLMFAGTVQADAGLPILAGLAGVIVGKSRTATTVVAGTTGTTGQQGGAGTPGQQGGGGVGDPTNSKRGPAEHQNAIEQAEPA